MEYKKCTNCGIILSIDNFYKNKSGKNGLHTFCKQCYKLYYKNNRETRLAGVKKYSKVKRDTLDNCYVIKCGNLDKNSPQELIDIVRTRIKIKRLIHNEKEKRKITV